MVSQVQNTGLANISAALVAYGSVPKYGGWGTGSAAAVTATALAVEVSDTARFTGTPTDETTTTTNDTFQVVGTLTATTARAITEAGLFDAATVGNLCVYGDFAVINLATGDSIAFTVKVVFDQA